MISSNEFRPGVIIQLDGDLYAVVETHHHKRAQRQAFVRAKLRNLRTGAVLETAPGVRGDTVSGGSKPARLETGVSVQVPLFVSVGDRIRVDTRTGAYLERVK